jgi:uncharacterized RDD family membrane protein YckC
MHCKYCGFNNGEDDHRCLRCGRRIGTAISAPTSYSGANALAPSFEANETQDFLPLPETTRRQASYASSGSNVIPFESAQRARTAPLPVARPQVAPRQVTAPQVTAQVTAQFTPEPPPEKPARNARKNGKASRTPSEQEQFDFVASAPVGKVLKTGGPAQVYSNRPVATPIHRFVAGAMDSAMVLLAFGMFMGITQLMGAGFGTGKTFWILMGASFAMISALYGLLFALMGQETAGMHWTDLQLITFDGFPVDGRSRAARVASTWLSFCSGGLGLVWALADEETLTWQDHISKTFPTVRETSGSFVRQG